MRKLTRGFVKVLATLVLGGACLGLGLQANAVFLNFETLSDGVTVPPAYQSAQTEYASQGVTFAGGGTAGQPVFRDYNSLSPAIAALPIGNNWFITTLDRTGGGSNFDIDIFFNKPVYSASGDVVIHPSYSMQVSAYDAANTLLASSSVPAGASTWIAGSFSFSTGTPIARIKLLPSSPAAAGGLDNLRFATNPTVASPFVANPPVIDGFVGFGEWPNSGQLNLQNGFIRVVNDGIRLYVLIDLLDDSGDDAGDYFWLTFDTNRNGAITANVDQNYGMVGGNMRYQYYLGPGSWTGVQPTTYSSRAKGFGCFFADGSLKFVFPFSLTCNSHRVWELAIDLAEISATPGSYVRMGLRAASSSPAFVENTPVNFTTDFSSLIIVNLAAAVLPPANPLASIVLVANPIEVTQAIQTRTNTMPLVADKTGVARVYVDVNGVAVSQPSIVNLYGTKAGVDLPGSPLASLHMAPTTINREQLNNTANFQLPKTWDNGTVEFKATARSRLGSLSSSTPFSLPFTDKRKPNYWIVPINTGTALAPVLPSNADIASQESYLEAVYPVADVNFIRKSWQVIGPTTVGNTIDDLNSYYNNVVLAWILSVLFGSGPPYDLPDQIYGFTPSGGGISDPTWFNSGAGRVARGFQGTSIEGTMAHEINHNLDRSATGTWGRHVPLGCGAGGPDPSWPFANDDIQEVGFDTRLPWTVVPPPRTAVPANFPDFMSYCQSGTLPTKWISTYRWQNLFGVMPALAPVADTAAASEAVAKIQQVYYVSGHVNINGTGALNPILVQYGMPTEQVTPGKYVVELLDAAGQPLMRVPFFVMFEDVEGNKVDTVAFNFQLPAVQGVAAVVLRLGTSVLATIKVSRNAPVVRLISPNGGERWSGFQKVAWEAGDVDGDPLSFSLLYSPSGGKTWLPVASGLTGNSYQINTALLQGSNAGLLRIIVTDGFNTAQDDSDGMFGVAGNPPEVHVNAPADGAQLPAGVPIHFDGDATDTEEDSLPETAFVWLDGDVAIGQGRVVDAALPGGKHTVTLAVSDSQGLVGKASVQIQVGQDTDGDGVFDDQDNCTLVPNPDQRDTNKDGYGNLCDADLNNDKLVNSLDLSLFKKVFLTNNPDADLNGDGLVNSKDLSLFKTLFLKAPGPSGLVP